MPLPQKKLIPSILLMLALAAFAVPPLWWSAGVSPVIAPGATENNQGPANIGQAKHMAKSALDALRPILPAVADEIEADLAEGTNPILGFTVPDPKTQEWIEKQKAPLLIGQLKAISAPFYTRLHAAAPTWLAAERTTNGTLHPNSIFPWTAETTDDANQAIATIGQLKAVFALRFESLPPQDSDGDGMPDAFETAYGLNPNASSDASGDQDSDGLTNLWEYTHQYQGFSPSDPSDATRDSTANGIPDWWEITYFNGITSIDPSTDPDSDGLTNLQEYQNGTHPNNGDTDGDGLTDEQEALLHTNPNVSENSGIAQGSIVNGDFSSPTIGSGIMRYSDWDVWTSMPDWTAIVGSNIEYQTIEPLPAGTQYCELKAHTSGHHGIQQTVGTVQGKTYLIVLDCKARSGDALTDSEFKIRVDDKATPSKRLLDQTVTFSDFAWTQAAATFTATTSITTIGLLPTNLTKPTRGCFVDNVRLLPMEVVPDDGQPGKTGDQIPSNKGVAGEKHFVSPKKTTEIPDDFVVFKAVGVEQDRFVELLEWEGGEADPTDPMKRRVKRDAATKTVVKIKVKQGGAEAGKINVWVVWSEVNSTVAADYQFLPSGNPTDRWSYSSSQLRENYWRFRFTIQPATIITDADRPKLDGANDTKPPGHGSTHHHLTQYPADHASHKWDTSRQLEVTVVNPNLIPKASFPALPEYANQPKAQDVPVPFPNDPVQGNDDPGGAGFLDEDSNPYSAFQDPTRPDLEHQIGQISCSDRPEIALLNSMGVQGSTLGVVANFKEFARLNLNPNGTNGADGEGWYRISDHIFWHYVMAATYGEHPTGSGTFRWVDSGSVSATGRFDIPEEP